MRNSAYFDLEEYHMQHLSVRETECPFTLETCQGSRLLALCSSPWTLGLPWNLELPGRQHALELPLPVSTQHSALGLQGVCPTATAPCPAFYCCLEPELRSLGVHTNCSSVLSSLPVPHPQPFLTSLSTRRLVQTVV